MAEYIVKPGDSLSKIATGKLGSAGLWRVIAALNGIINPNRIRVGQRLQLPGTVTEVPSVVNTAEGVQTVSKVRVRISVEGSMVFATLLLDNQVNRPGYMHSCMAAALDRSNLTAAELSRGGDAEEQLVIKNYLDVRQTYGKHPMTDARQRASVIRGYVVDGIISAGRGSFLTDTGA